MRPLLPLACWLALFDAPPPPGAPSPAGAGDSPPPDAPLSPVARLEPRPLRRMHPRELVGYGTMLGLALSVIAGVWAIGLRGMSPGAWFPARTWPADLGIGVAAGVLFTAITWALHHRVRGLRRMSTLLMMALDMRAVRPHHALLFGLLAGFPEELFFRGAMQPVLGLLLTAAIFGALHAATPTYYVYATSAGVLLGVLAEWREGLWAPIAAHTVIDVLMFLLLLRAWRRSQHSAEGV